MYSAAWSMTWSLGYRHRWGLSLTVLYVLGMAVLVRTVSSETLAQWGDPYQGSLKTFGRLISLPFLMALAYLAAGYAAFTWAISRARQTGMLLKLSD